MTPVLLHICTEPQQPTEERKITLKEPGSVTDHKVTGRPKMMLTKNVTIRQVSVPTTHLQQQTTQCQGPSASYTSA